MDIFHLLNMLGGLCLFLFGMSIMGQALERRAGGGLKDLLGRFTSGRAAGLLSGLLVTAVIQSSSVTTVMVVGFVNSGIMTLRQSINVIMGANIGTTVTAWVLSLAGISSGNVWVKLFKPSSFTPVLALIGTILYMTGRKSSKKDTGMILLGFAVLMQGMETMSGAVSGLKEISGFRQMFLLFSNPVLGVLVGAALTAVIQSSSASVGILQALASTGAVSYAAAIPIIMGQNIGTCVTALISSIGANKNAKRAAMVHLSFNVIGTAFWLAVYCLIRAVFDPAALYGPASLLGIAIIHSVFNVLCTLLMLPFGSRLEGLVRILVPDGREAEHFSELDERLLTSPALALARSRELAAKMCISAAGAMKKALGAMDGLIPGEADEIRAAERLCDHYEDILGTYLVKVSSRKLSPEQSAEAAALLKLIGDCERISDHAVGVLESAEELRDKKLSLSPAAKSEFGVIARAVEELLDLSGRAFEKSDTVAAKKIEPLTRVVAELKNKLRTNHIRRMQEGRCPVEVGFVWSDLLTELERVSSHCSNIAGCIADEAGQDSGLHESIAGYAGSREFAGLYRSYSRKYSVE